MKRKKNLFTISLCLFAALFVSACGSGGSSSTDSKNTENQTASATKPKIEGKMGFVELTQQAKEDMIWYVGSSNLDSYTKASRYGNEQILGVLVVKDGKATYYEGKSLDQKSDVKEVLKEQNVKPLTIADLKDKKDSEVLALYKEYDKKIFDAVKDWHVKDREEIEKILKAKGSSGISQMTEAYNKITYEDYRKLNTDIDVRAILLNTSDGKEVGEEQLVLPYFAIEETFLHFIHNGTEIPSLDTIKSDFLETFTKYKTPTINGEKFTFINANKLQLFTRENINVEFDFDKTDTKNIAQRKLTSKEKRPIKKVEVTE